MNSPRQYIAETRSLYDHLGYPPYRWFHADTPAPFAPPAKPLSDSRLGLVSTAGAYVHGQVAFHYKDDTSIRAIPKQTPADQLRFSHVTENYLLDAREDPRCVFPIDALADLQADGVIGELADNYYSCMGGVYSQRRVTEELIPALRQAVDDEAVDLLLLVPL